MGSGAHPSGEKGSRGQLSTERRARGWKGRAMAKPPLGHGREGAASSGAAFQARALALSYTRPCS